MYSLRARISEPQVTMTVGVNDDWSIYWTAAFECGNIAFSDSEAVKGEFGVSGAIILRSNTSPMSVSPDIGICALNRSADKKDIYGLNVTIFLPEEKIQKISEITMKYDPFGIADVDIEDMYLDHSKASSWDGVKRDDLYWKVDENERYGQKFSHVSSINLISRRCDDGVENL